MELFEIKNNIKFPSLYADFLKKYNGGYTPKTSFDINGISSDIRYFHGFEANDEDCDFSSLIEFDDFTSCINNHYLPIATDSLGNLIVIGIGNNHNGKIYFLDTEIYKYSYLSSDFKNFISKIDSQDFIMRTIEQRILSMKDSSISIDDSLIKLWQAEIDKYSDIKQQAVSI